MPHAEEWRCFVAVPIGSELRSVLSRTVDSWRTAEAAQVPEELRWTDPENWHLTLAFLGATAPADVPRIAERLSTAVAGEPSFREATGGLGAFPTPPAARVLWYGVEDSQRRLSRLAHAVRHSVCMPGNARFRPHLTLARARQPISLKEWLASATAPDGELVVDRVQLYRSHLSGGPARYEVLAEVALEARVAQEAGRG